jgi:hypothetical protein
MSIVHLATRLATDSLVARLAAELAGRGRAIACTMALNAAQVAVTRERTLDLRIGAVGLVVSSNGQYQNLVSVNNHHNNLPNLSAVEAFSSHTSASRLVRTIAGEVAGLMAAV